MENYYKNAMIAAEFRESVTSQVFQKVEKSEKFQTFENYYVFCSEKKNYACIHLHVVLLHLYVSKVGMLFPFENLCMKNIYIKRTNCVQYIILKYCGKLL